MNVVPVKREIWQRGDTILIEHEDVTDVTGALVTSFSGYKMHASLKLDPDSDDDASAVAKLETADYVASGSTLRAYLQTESLSLTLDTDYYLDSQVIDGNGYVSTLIKRKIRFVRDVSRRIVDTP